MSVKIDRKLVLQTTSDRFDKYCNRVGGAVSLYHLSAWRQIINRTYGHQTYLLIAIEDGRQHKIVESSNWNEQTEDNTGSGETNSRRVAGILPLIHLKSFAFANELISMPFFDSGGVLADDADVEKALLREAVSLAQRLKVKSIQLRQTLPLLSLPESGPETQDSTANSWLPALDCTVQKRLHKARMLLELPESSEALMGSFKSKLRSQIRKPEKRDWLEKSVDWNSWMTSTRSSQ